MLLPTSVYNHPFLYRIIQVQLNFMVTLDRMHTSNKSKISNDEYDVMAQMTA